MSIGHRTWVFPDGDIPPRQAYDPALANPEVNGHESLIILNAGSGQVQPIVKIYFSEQAPWEIHLPPISAERVICYRLDEPLGPQRFRIPPGQYSLVLTCDHPVVAQFGRMDVRQSNLAYYTVMGFPVESSLRNIGVS